MVGFPINRRGEKDVLLPGPGLRGPRTTQIMLSITTVVFFLRENSRATTRTISIDNFILIQMEKTIAAAAICNL